MSERATLPADAPRVLALLERVLPRQPVGVYLYGSCVAGGLQHQSDLDLMVVVDAALPDATRQALVAALLPISGWQAVDPASRPLDLTVVQASELKPWRPPARCELIFGEWLRVGLAAQRIAPPAPRPDLAIQISALLQHHRVLAGAPVSSVFDPVPFDDLRRAILACLPDLRAGLGGDERNVLLTLARMWITLATRRIVPKDEAALWAMQRLPAPQARMLDLARAGYLGEQDDAGWPARVGVAALERQLVAGIEAQARAAGASTG